MRTIDLGPVTFTPAKDFLLIAGPCVIESLEMCLRIGESVQRTAARLGVPYVFKASFDKANRSSVKTFRGHGLDKGLEVLAAVKKKLGVPVTTDIHESGQAAAVAEVCELLQIPAFLCRQTDLLVAAGNTKRAVSIKKGQFMAPWEMANAVEKVQGTGNPQVMLIERGTFFGYNRLVNDFTGIPQMQALGGGEAQNAPPQKRKTQNDGGTEGAGLSTQDSALVTPVLMDATHSTQLPGGLGHATAGQRQYVPLLARAATAAGVNGLFIEVHPEPVKSPSDAATIFPLDQLEGLLGQCLKIRAAIA